MSTARCVLLLLACGCFFSCQKELSVENPVIPVVTDSTWLIKSIKTVDYDSTDLLLFEKTEVFTYDTILNRTVVAMSDSQRYSPGVVERYESIFQYDSDGRLAWYSADNDVEPVKRMDFSYNAAGDVIKTTMQGHWSGKTISWNYGITLVNGQKTITAYDTSGVFNNFSDYRPEIASYTFDDNKRLVKEVTRYTLLPEKKEEWYRNTYSRKLSYAADGRLEKVITDDAYHPVAGDPKTYSYHDSTLYSSSGDASVLRNSFYYVYRNMYWLNISEYNSGFADPLHKNYMIPYTGYVMATAENWSFSPPDPQLQEHVKGSYENTIDANGRLVKSVYPKEFANKYHGKTVYYYTYAKRF